MSCRAVTHTCAFALFILLPFNALAGKKVLTIDPGDKFISSADTGLPVSCLKKGEKIYAVISKKDRLVKSRFRKKVRASERFQNKKAGYNRLLKLIEKVGLLNLTRKKQRRFNRLLKYLLPKWPKLQRQACATEFLKKEGDDEGDGEDGDDGGNTDGGGDDDKTLGDDGGDGELPYWTKYTGEFGFREARILLEVFGFGGRRAEIEELQALGLDAATDKLLTWIDEPELEAEYLEYRTGTGNPLSPYFNLARAKEAKYQLLRKTVNPVIYNFILFAHSNFNAAQDVGLSNRKKWFVEAHFELLRDFAKFWDYRFYMFSQPMDGLVSYHNLDLAQSNAPSQDNPDHGINQNYAREVVEIATTGKETLDGEEIINPTLIASIANVLAGRRYRNESVHIGDPDGDGVPDYLPINVPEIRYSGQVPGPKLIFAGTEYEQYVETEAELIEALLGHHATYENVAKKLIEHYIEADPENQVVRELAAVIRQENGSLRKAMLTLMRSAKLYDAEREKTHAKSPIQALVSFMRILGRYPTGPKRLRTISSSMGHNIMSPGNREAGDIFGWDFQALILERIIEKRNGIKQEMSLSPGQHEDRGYELYERFVLPEVVEPYGDLPAAEAFVTALTDLFGLKLSEAQRNVFIHYLNHDYRICSAQDEAQHGCQRGEYFYAEELMSLNPNHGANRFHYKVLGGLALMMQLPEPWLM